MSQTDRTQYWNGDYFRYWKARVDEANLAKQGASNLVKGDALTTDDEAYVNAVAQLLIQPTDTVLEMGCGFGRSLPFLSAHAQKIHAIDISVQMIDAAKEICSNLNNVEYAVCEAETTPFANNTFDQIVCFAVFDALHQGRAIVEMNRILKVGGKLLLTGKADNYFDDDDQAWIAERNARAKGHPNFFTNVQALLDVCPQLGFQCLGARYFLRRGDTARQQYVTEQPQHFYEYQLVLQKTGSSTVPEVAIASDYSKTFRRVDWSEK